MFCPKCGAHIGESSVCVSCGFDANEITDSAAATDSKTEHLSTKTTIEKPTRPLITVRIVVFSVMAIGVFVMFFIAASKIAKGGFNIMNIQSVGGKTLEEAYYFELGTIYAGYAMIARALGIFFASTLVWLGLKK